MIGLSVLRGPVILVKEYGVILIYPLVTNRTAILPGFITVDVFGYSDILLCLIHYAYIIAHSVEKSRTICLKVRLF